MNFLEKDLETIICETPNEVLADRGLSLSGCKRRQVRIGNYGIADIVLFDRIYEPLCPKVFAPKITILELKKDKIDAGAFLQAVGYLKGIKSYLRQKHYYNITKNLIFEIVLIGKEMDSRSNFAYLPDLIEPYENTGFGLTYYIYNYTIDGLDFESQSGYKLTEEGF